MKKRSGFGWVLLSTVCFWGVLLLGPVLLALWDAVSIFRLDPNSLAYAVFALLAQPISAGLAFYLSGAVLSDDAALPPCVNAVISASVLGVLTLLSASSQMAMLSYAITIVVLVVCAVKGFRKRVSTKEQVNALTTSAASQTAPAKEPQAQPNRIPYDLSLLDALMEQAYKDGYAAYRRGVNALVQQARVGEIDPDEIVEIEDQLSRQYMQAVHVQVGLELLGGSNELKSCTKYIAEQGPAVYRGVLASFMGDSYSAGQVYNNFWFYLTGSPADRHDIERHTARLAFYKRSALRKAFDEYWPDGASELLTTR